MNNTSTAPVMVAGKLVVKTIHGRNGDFNVGLLETAIGSFSVKNRELEQYTAGIYEGQFVIGKIYLHSWSYGANSGFEMRVRLDAMSIATDEALTPSDEQKLTPPVNDPLDEEESAPSPQPETSAEKAIEPTPAQNTAARRPQFVVPTSAEQEDDDQKLFGPLWPLGDIVKLDATAPRQVLRQQKARLSRLGYDFRAQEQHFIKTVVPAEETTS
ncbi:DUF3275 family protein [Lonsdalea quercina]|uniref:DUF3275 family protein n=1 Tax=Lonsdalea quercina TaxID=71657 RepID=UPI003975D66B